MKFPNYSPLIFLPVFGFIYIASLIANELFVNGIMSALFALVILSPGIFVALLAFVIWLGPMDE